MKLVNDLKQVALRLPDDLAEWLEQLAEEEERSVAYVVRKIIAPERERKKALQRAPPPDLFKVRKKTFPGGGKNGISMAVVTEYGDKSSDDKGRQNKAGKHQ